MGLSGSVFAADLNPTAPCWHVADASFPAPLFKAGTFIDDMLALCEQQRIGLVVPTIDTELALYADHLDAFQQIGTTVGISAPETIHICGDKQRTHDWLVSQGFPTPRQATIQAVLDDPDAWPLPLLAKPRGGSSSVGVTRINHMDDLAYARQHGEMIVQTLATGQEYTVDVYVDRAGTPRCSVPRLRVETRAGEVSKGLTVRDPAIQRLAEQVCAALPGAYGVLNVQMFVDESTGEKNIIEFNARFGGGYPLSHEAGAHCTRWLIEETLGRPVSATADGWRNGLAMLRFDDAVFVDRAAAGL